MYVEGQLSYGLVMSKIVGVLSKKIVHILKKA